MKKLKLNALNVGADEILTREQLRMVMGGTADGSGDGHCDEGPCDLYISSLGITVIGQCVDRHTGGSIRCLCKHNEHETAPTEWSTCNID